MFVTCCCHISTRYSERQTQVVFQLCVHFGWSSQLMKLLSVMTKPSWLVAVFWCKGYLLRCYCHLVSTSSCLYYVNFSSCFIVWSCESKCVIYSLCSISERNMRRYICPVDNHGITWVLGLHTKEAQLIRSRFQKIVFLPSNGLEPLCQGKTGFAEAPPKWPMILTLWYVFLMCSYNLIVICWN